MNSDRIIKVLEWRPQISVSSDNTYDPDDRKDLEECMLDVFRQFCEFKKKKYNLTLSTSLDTQELGDMDVAILICSIEKAFGVEIPHDELASMDTFNDIATYINDYHKNKTFVINIKTKEDKKKEQQSQKPCQIETGIGCWGVFVLGFAWLAIIMIFYVLEECFVTDSEYLTLTGFACSLIGVFLLYGHLKRICIKNKGNQIVITSQQQFWVKGIAKIIIVIFSWLLPVCISFCVLTFLHLPEHLGGLSFCVGALTSYLVYLFIERKKGNDLNDIL